MIGIMVQILIVAVYVIVVDIVFRAFFFETHKDIAAYVGLIITNCIVLGRLEAFASSNPPLAAAADGLGAGLGLLTAWCEKHLILAKGSDWDFSFLDRCLIAGRALWFYPRKLLWPADVTFIYPRWQIDTAVWWQWLFPLGGLALVAVLLMLLRRVGRGPLVAVLIFAGTLFPALGFIDTYPMLFSFVADHFQYLASIALIVLAASAAATLLTRLGVRPIAKRAI